MGHIFYGAGRNAELNIEKWIKNGYKPDCFVDKDPQKQHAFFNCKSFPDGIEVLPLDEAIEKYPNDDIYVTLVRSKLKEVTEELIEKNIEVKSIKYFEDVEYRLGCEFLMKCFVMESKIRTCCAPQYSSVGLPISGDIYDDYKKYLLYYNKILLEWKKGNASSCSGCKNLEYGIYEKRPIIQEINISSKNNADVCNAKCLYCCGFPYQSKEVHMERKREIVEMLGFFEKYFPDRNLTVAVSGGDISVAPFRKELFQIIERNNWNAKIMTNGAIYCEEITQALKNPKTSVMVTVDTMDAALFAQIKGINCLDKVVNNLRIYSKVGNVWIKWIALENVYSTFEQIRRIADLAEEIGAGICVSCNVYNISVPMSNQLKSWTTEFIKYVQSKQIKLNIMFDHFNEIDSAYLKSMVVS